MKRIKSIVKSGHGGTRDNGPTKYPSRQMSYTIEAQMEKVPAATYLPSNEPSHRTKEPNYLPASAQRHHQLQQKPKPRKTSPPSYLPNVANTANHSSTQRAIYNNPYTHVPPGLMDDTVKSDFPLYTLQPPTARRNHDGTTLQTPMVKQVAKNTIPTKSEWAREKTEIEKEIALLNLKYGTAEDDFEASSAISMAISESRFEKDGQHKYGARNEMAIISEGTQYIDALGGGSAKEHFNLTGNWSDGSESSGY